MSASHLGRLLERSALKHMVIERLLLLVDQPLLFQAELFEVADGLLHGGYGDKMSGGRKLNRELMVERLAGCGVMEG